MDSALVQAIAAVVFGGGGIWGIVNWYMVRRSTQKGTPNDERKARRLTENGALNRYWQQELNTARADRKDELRDLRAQIRNLQQALQEQTLSDAARIEQLETHIWMRLPPPPPKRATRSKEK